MIELLRAWREEDHQDSVLLTRHQVIQLIEEFNSAELRENCLDKALKDAHDEIDRLTDYAQSD